MAVLPITNGFYISRSLPISHQECTNWYVSAVENAGLADRVLFGTPGIRLLTSTGAGEEINRGAHVKNNIPYIVNGEKLYRLDMSLTPASELYSTTYLGAIAGAGRVSMADNGTQLIIIVPGGKGYIYNENADPALQEITSSGFTAHGNPQFVVYIDGYFVITTDSKKWMVSALNDGLSWNPLDFSSAESDPDAIVAPVVVKNQLFITGSQTTEGFQNIGGTYFPFQRNNVFIDKGCYAPFSLVNANGTFYMIGGGVNEGPAVWQLSDESSFVKRSTNAIDSILSSYTSSQLKNAIGWTYSDGGAQFVGFTLYNRTIVYDITTGLWHERKSLINGASTRWRANCIITVYGRTIVGDAFSGNIGSLELETYQEYGTDINRVVSTQPFFAAENELVVPRIELYMEMGVGDNDTINPVIGLSISKDGKTFNYERVRSIGKTGQYTRRAVWRKNGRFSKFVVLRFRFSSPVKPVIIKLEAD